MIYTITEGGLVFHVAPEHVAEEQETDRLVDEWHARLAPITQAEIDATIKRVSRDVNRVTLFDYTHTMYEDELPEDMPEGDYKLWFSKSYVDGVRIGPRYVLTTGRSRPDTADLSATAMDHD